MRRMLPNSLPLVITSIVLTTLVSSRALADVSKSGETHPIDEWSGLGFSVLQTIGPHGAKFYYERLFGWKISSSEVDPRWLAIEPGQGPGGTIWPATTDASAWVPFFTVPCLDSALHLVRRLFGKVIVPHQRIPIL